MFHFISNVLYVACYQPFQRTSTASPRHSKSHSSQAENDATYKPSLHEAVRGAGDEAPNILNLALDGSDLPALHRHFAV
jgi:hypothetical protein